MIRNSLHREVVPCQIFADVGLDRFEPRGAYTASKRKHSAIPRSAECQSHKVVYMGYRKRGKPAIGERQLASHHVDVTGEKTKCFGVGWDVMSCPVLDRTCKGLQHLERRHHRHLVDAREHHRSRFGLQDGDTGIPVKHDLVACLRKSIRPSVIDQ